MITPFAERSVSEGMTYGLSPAGYDICVGPGEERCVLRRNGFVLAVSLEHFQMPLDVMGHVCDKSTWARQGVTVQNTIIEPGWEGFLTLELINHSSTGYFLWPRTPIAQVVFMQLDQPTEQPYRGKYQNQSAVPTPARKE